MVERYQQIWADEMMILLVDIKKLVEAAKDNDLDNLTFEQISDCERRYQEILEKGFTANPQPPIEPDAPKKRVVHINKLKLQIQKT